MSSPRKRSTMEDELPPNLMFDIISRVPVKSIIQCKCVCKKWHNLVSDPYFVHLHLSKSPEALIMHEGSSQDSPGTVNWVEIKHESDHQHIVPVKKLQLERCPPLLEGFLVSVQGSVNGLICVCKRNGAVFIFNPVLEQYISIPPPRRLLGTISYGFGVSTAGEYKIIRISVNCHDSVYEISVYTLGTCRWRLLRRKLPYVHKWIQDVDPGVFVNNNHVYWLLPDAQIYDFDLITETFEMIPSPPKDDDKRETGVMLGVLKGRLSKISWFSLGLEVWLMKEGCWYNEIAIREVVSPVVMWSDKSEPSCLVDGLNGTSVLMVLKAAKIKEVVACCLDTNTILNTDLQGYFSSFMFTYRPSFVKLVSFGAERVHAMDVLQQEEVGFDSDAFEGSAENKEAHEFTATTELAGPQDGMRHGDDSSLEKGEIEQAHSRGENAQAGLADESEASSDLESETSDEIFDFDDSEDLDAYFDSDDSEDSEEHEHIGVFKQFFSPCSDGDDQEDEGVVDGSKDADDGEGGENVISGAGENAK